jgi:hypothetical protein
MYIPALLALTTLLSTTLAAPIFHIAYIDATTNGKPSLKHASSSASPSYTDTTVQQSPMLVLHDQTNKKKISVPLWMTQAEDKPARILERASPQWKVEGEGPWNGID